LTRRAHYIAAGSSPRFSAAWTDTQIATTASLAEMKFMKYSARRIAIIFALLCSLSLSAAAFKDTWTSVRSKNFFLVGNASDKDIRKVATRLEQFREVFSRLLPNAKLNSQAPIHVLVFKNKAAYRPFMPVYNGKVSEVAGYYQPGQDLSYITLTSEFSATNPYSTIFHEYVHAITNDNIGQMPPWFGEGLAEYYETFEISDGDKKVLLGKPQAHHVYLLRENKFMPLARLFAVDHGSPEYNEKDKKGVFYAESWALVHYLMLGARGARYPQLEQFLQLLGKGVSIGESFQQAFQTDYATLEKELRDYINHNTYPVTWYTFDQKLEFDSALQSAPITEAEWNYHLGDLLRHSARNDSEEYLQRATQLDPNLTLAQASLGMLRMRQNKFDEAKNHLERALAAESATPEKPANYLAHYYYAYTLSREGADDNIIRGYTTEQAAKIRAALKKAIALNPDFAESYNLYAFVSLLTGQELDEAVKMLRRAIVLAPSRQEYRMQLAQLYLRQNKLSEARQILDALAGNSPDPRVREQAGSLIESVDRQIRFQAEYENQARAQNSAASTIPAGNEAKLMDALRRPTMRRRFEGDKASGQLTRLDCTDKGVVLTIQAADRTLKFQAASLERVSFISSSPDVGAGITCEQLKKPLPVIITYRASTDAKSLFDGEPIAVEFVKPEQ
jgi:tetratricopeptide (TPR) repeat protein